MKFIRVILFMMLISAVYIGALAVLNALTKPVILLNQEVQDMKSILYAFSILPDHMDEKDLSGTATTGDINWLEDDVLAAIRNEFRIITLPVFQNEKSLLKNSFLSADDSVQIYVRLNENKNPEAYGFKMRGKGLWGTISAFGTMDTSMTHMIGIDFTEQVETPGLGARITEQEFKYFFRGLDISGLSLSGNQTSGIQMVREKSASNLESPDNTLQAITGATQTCNGVIKMLNTDLMFYKKILKNHKSFILDQLQG